jgi:prepilin-type N-terminal cleavage/methylation domain-containing protein
MRKNKGFSLIELLIAVAIILIIAAIAIPNLLRARIAANESAAARQVQSTPRKRLAVHWPLWATRQHGSNWPSTNLRGSGAATAP